ncbi:MULTISPECIES: hypothetical protein [Streptosporangiaceae]|uniref:hypothetical protein n=1 Tax=Streptosporangiaceae TaxID=2004 RepID=UPI0033F807D8
MPDALFDLADAAATREPADPKGMRELLFAGLVAQLAAAVDDEMPDYIDGEYRLDPDGIPRSGSPYWQAYQHACGLRAALSMVRAKIATHEEYLRADRECIRASWSETEMACARHRDVCPRCAEVSQAAWVAGRSEARARRLVDVYVGGISNLMLAVGRAMEVGEDISMASVERALHRILDAAKREQDRKEAADA